MVNPRSEQDGRGRMNVTLPDENAEGGTCPRCLWLCVCGRCANRRGPKYGQQMGPKDWCEEFTP